ncbi:MAG: formylglycine-generating enzyme family protein, partial [Planctomycetes bacterium]|nr:formylglycine-generating enzyme family protein [Planctomycetota bacterium]
SCVGCHDHQNTSPPVRQVATAAVRPPSEIKPWYGPARGFGFTREVQPVLDRHCTSCHNGQVREDGQTLVDLTDRPHINMQAGSGTYNGAAHFSPSYFELRKFVRSPTIESDLHMLPPREFHADTTKLMQILRKGHHGVTLDVESRDRLVTWIDLHTPAHGTWADICGTGRVANQAARRAAMRKLYTGMDDDPEAITTPYATTPSLPRPRVAPRGSDTPTVANWPFDATEAVRRQTAAGEPATLGIDLGEGMKLQLALIPAGQFVMGDNAGYDDEGPAHAARIDRPFWMGQFEITNAQYALFDPGHDSRLEHGDFLQFSSRERGYPVNSPQQPVVRVSQQQAAAFCRWLSEKTGRRFMLPCEAQWEYAARAGTATSHWYGDLDTDFAPAANLSDATHHGEDTLGWGLPSGAIPPWRPADVRFNDKHRVSAPVGTFAANPWGLHDMHGNVAEWTRSSYRPYPYDAADGRNEPSATAKRVVRGGSWYDRPKRARSASRLAYAADQVVFDVGFRVICAVDAERVAKGED